MSESININQFITAVQLHADNKTITTNDIFANVREKYPNTDSDYHCTWHLAAGPTRAAAQSSPPPPSTPPSPRYVFSSLLHVSSSALHETRSALNCLMLLLISSIITAIGSTVAVRSAACCVRLFISVSPFSALAVAPLPGL